MLSKIRQNTYVKVACFPTVPDAKRKCRRQRKNEDGKANLGWIQHNKEYGCALIAKRERISGREKHSGYG